MWSYVVPFLLDLGSSPSKRVTYNILLHSQRGHGLSTLPLPTDSEKRLTTIPLLATDILHLLEALGIPTPVHSVIGVSQGGATTLAFAALYGDKTRSVVVCDTAPTTAPGNKEAWEERTRVVCGTSTEDWDKRQGNIDIEAYAQKVGMRKLAKMTIPRWFPEGSACHPGSGLDSDGRTLWMEEMIVNTDVKGFFHGAKALGSYDVMDIESPLYGKVKRLFETRVEKVLLVAGSLDGGGKVGQRLKDLRESWIVEKAAPSVEYVEIGGSGHLPMIESPEAFCDVVAGLLCL
jgi:pimeloyl-ACP methyl ester carboxylesterase